MHFSLLTLFPDFFSAPLESSILNRAKQKKQVTYSLYNIRDFCDDKHRQVDDTVYGGGAGMLIKPDPVAKSIEYVSKQHEESEVIFFAPWGEKLTQSHSYAFAKRPSHKILLCGHYEGVDDRVIQSHIDHVFSIGETVLTGGEIPALFFLDSVVRLLPGVIGQEASHQTETFSFNLYGKGEYPQYTKPAIWRGIKVPDVLLSGNHEKITQFQQKNLRNCTLVQKKVIELRNTVFSPIKPKKYRNFLLRTPIPTDIDIWTQWLNDTEVCQYTHYEGITSREKEEDFFSWQHYNLHLLLLQIIDKKTKKLIGRVSLEFSKDESSAKLGLILGEKELWNKGFGTQVVKEMIHLSHSFPSIIRLELDVFCDNIFAQKVYEKCGFQKVGKRKKFYYKNGQWFDVFLYEKIKEDLLEEPSLKDQNL